MKKALKIISIVFISLLLLISIGIFILVHYVDPNHFKKNISQFVGEKTGHTLVIQGNISWSFFPWIGFQVNDVSIDNPKEFGPGPLLTLKEADISLKLLPLFIGRVVVNTVALDGLHLTIIQNSAGQINLISVKKNSAQNTSMPAPISPAAPSETSDNNASLPFISINHFTIINSEIDVKTPTPATNVTLSDIYISADNGGFNTVFPFSVAFTLSAPLINKSLPISLSSNVDIASDLQDVALDEITADIDTLHAKGDLEITNALNAPSFKANVRTSPMDIQKLLALFKVPPIATADPKALSSVSFNISASGNTQLIKLEPFNIKLDKSNISGSAQINLTKIPTINLDLSADALNVDNYLPVSKTSQPGKASENTANTVANSETSANTSPKKEVVLPFELLSKFNANITLKSNEFIVKKIFMQHAKLTMVLNNGQLQMPLSATLYEGNLTSTTRINAAQKSIAFTAGLQNIQMQRLVNDVLGKNQISGVGNLNFQCTSKGSTVQNQIQSLQGNGSFKLSNGVFYGVNLENRLLQAGALIQKKAPPADSTDQSTPFGSLTGTITLNKGVIKNNDLLIQNNAFTGKGAGSIDLNTQNIDYRLTLTTNAIPELKGYTIPMSITGSLSAISYKLDLVDITKQVLVNQGQAQIASLLGNIKFGG